MALSLLIERSVGPLDQVRRSWFSLLVRSPGLTSLIARRDRRIPLLAAIHALFAFVLAAYYPVLLFVLGPLTLGIAHVASDVRYLVVRRGLPAWWRKGVLSACVVLIALRLARETRLVSGVEPLEMRAVLTWAVVAIAAGLAESRAYFRGLCGVGVLGAWVTAAELWPRASQLAFLHVHNLVAIALWALWFRPKKKPLLAPLAAIFVGTILLASGSLYRVAWDSNGSAWFGVQLFQAADWLAPGLRADYAIGVTSAYVFLQSIHYAIWLNFIPQEDSSSEGTLTFRMTVRSLLADLRPAGVLAILVASAALLVAGVLHPARTRGFYVSIAMFHAYLELVMFLYFWVAKSTVFSHARPVYARSDSP